MTGKTLGNLAAAISVAIIVGWGIYWGTQVMSAVELIAIANETG